jgi:hypothetical protein
MTLMTAAPIVTGWSFFALAAGVALLNFYLSFLRVPLHRWLGRECRRVSGYPLFGNLLLAGAAPLPVSFAFVLVGCRRGGPARHWGAALVHRHVPPGSDTPRVAARYRGRAVNEERTLRFVPSRVEGLPDVAEVAVFPDRLELESAGRRSVYPFAAMARWPWPAWLWRLLFRLGLRTRRPPVADRDWFHPPPDRFFAFYTTPRLVVYMPPEEPAMGYADTYFVRVQRVIGAGGFSTFDLG